MIHLLSLALAFSTATPYVRLIPIAPTQIAVTTHRAACDSPAAVDGVPFFEMPTIAAEQGVSGVARVKIDITSGGNLAAAALFSSSGNRWLDEAALRSARMTHYTAATIGCERVAGSYLYEVEF